MTSAYSSTAAIASKNTPRVYFQGKDGYVRESRFNESGVETTRLFPARPNTPIAAIAWKMGIACIYYIDNNDILQERLTLDVGGLWTLGSLGDLQIKVDYRSKIAVCGWGENSTFFRRVNYQAPCEFHVTEAYYGEISQWELKTHCVEAVLGSGLAAVALGDMGSSIYYQDQNLMVREHCLHRDGGTTGTTTLGKAVIGTAISAIALPSEQIRVYYEHTNGKVVENRYGSGSVPAWSGPQHLTNSLIGTSLSACWWASKGIQKRIYLQQEMANLREYCGSEWAQGTVLPFPN